MLQKAWQKVCQGTAVRKRPMSLANERYAIVLPKRLLHGQAGVMAVARPCPKPGHDGEGACGYICTGILT